MPPQWVTPSEFREDKNIQTWLVKIVSRDIRHITECYNGHTRKIMWRGVIHGKQFNSFPTKLQHSPRRCCRTREKHFRITVVRITKWSTSKRELIDWLIDWYSFVTYKLGVTVYKCLHGQASDYLSELCTPVAQVAERQHLRSASRHLLVVPRFQLDTYSRRTFAVVGPMTWNLFQNNLREPDMQIDCFRRTLKTCLFDQYSAHWAH